ncbi:MAG: SWIM zinc finger family protein [Thermoplasmata archaeon]
MFRTAHQPLFPESDSDFQSDCNCPDWANPCKHIAAVHYVIGEALDRDPFLLFLLRGRPREDLMEEMRKMRSRRADREVGAPGPAAPPKVPHRPREPPSRPSEFWKSALPTSSLVLRIDPPRIARAPLRRLGEPPFLRGDPEALRMLESFYDRISARALALAVGETAGSPPPGSNSIAISRDSKNGTSSTPA